jgi:aspartyl-tRNA(Asn)/glutamyl-tRNA(Gln) amidotransferase subunit A
MAIDHLLARRLTGKPLALVAQALRRSPSVAALGAEALRHELGIDKLEALEGPLDELELDLAPRPGRPARSLNDPLEAPVAPAWVSTSEALTAAYRERRITPLELVQKVLRQAEAVARKQPLLRCFWMRDDATALREAEAATQRYARGEARGPLDGVPFAVKEHIGIRGFPCRSGHDLPSDELSPEDATIVARLREAGAIVVGQTAMTELGLSPLGINPKRPALRNPHHVERVAGGSSTGSGVATALGLVPFAIGTDGGGSVRIPAALCGVFGLKPTYGRVSRAVGKLSGSLTHVGPLASSVLDLAHFLDVVSGPDPRDIATLRAPAPGLSFADSARRRVRGLVLGIDEHELRDADPEVVRTLEHSIRAIETCGVRLVNVRLPLASAAFAIGSLTITAETLAAEALDLQRHAAAFGHDMQVLMALSAQLGAHDYLRAQKLRQRMRKELARVFSEVDALALPTTQGTAPAVTATEERYGRIDSTATRRVCRHTFLANLTGLPAGTAPVGVDGEGLPIGLQLVGDAWDEGTLIALMAELSRLGVARAVRAPYHVELLA